MCLFIVAGCVISDPMRSSRHDALAEHPAAWESMCVTSGCMPQAWGDLLPDRKIIRLKDTGSGFYKNTMVDSVHFKYMLPKYSSLPVFSKLLSPDDRDAWTVHLFKVQHGKDHFLGEYIVHERHSKATDCNYVLLRRLRNQTDHLYTSTGQERRSKSEAMHEMAIRRIVPSHRVVHEPECSSGLSRPCVVAGTLNDWASEFYTADYVSFDLHRGLRVCWESKAATADLDAVAVDKCRALRDRGYHRVVAIAGHGDETLLHDFGSSFESEHIFSIVDKESMASFQRQLA